MVFTAGSVYLNDEISKSKTIKTTNSCLPDHRIPFGSHMENEREVKRGRR